MSSHPATRRRWLGAACLLGAIGLLAGSHTLLKGRTDGLLFIGYWLACFLFTAIAFGCAWLDAREVRRQTREEQRALFETTLREIEQEQTRKARETRPGRPS